MATSNMIYDLIVCPLSYQNHLLSPLKLPFNGLLQLTTVVLTPSQFKNGPFDTTICSFSRTFFTFEVFSILGLVLRYGQFFNEIRHFFPHALQYLKYASVGILHLHIKIALFWIQSIQTSKHFCSSAVHTAGTWNENIHLRSTFFQWFWNLYFVTSSVNLSQILDILSNISSSSLQPLSDLVNTMRLLYPLFSSAPYQNIGAFASKYFNLSLKWHKVCNLFSLNFCNRRSHVPCINIFILKPIVIWT